MFNMVSLGTQNFRKTSNLNCEKAHTSRRSPRKVYRISSNSSTPRNNRAPRNKRPWRKGFESISAPPEFAAHGRLLNLQQTCSARSTSVYTCTARNGFLLRHHCGFLEVFRSQTCHRSPPILFLLSWKLYTDNTLKSIGVRGTRPLNRYRPTTNRISKIRRAPRIKRAPRNKRAPSRSFELIAAQGYYSRKYGIRSETTPEWYLDERNSQSPEIPRYPQAKPPHSNLDGISC